MSFVRADAEVLADNTFPNTRYSGGLRRIVVSEGGCHPAAARNRETEESASRRLKWETVRVPSSVWPWARRTRQNGFDRSAYGEGYHSSDLLSTQYVI